MPSNSFLAEAAARGFVHQITDQPALDAALQAGGVAGYIGFDCTADSLHVGSLVQIMLLRLMQRHGHRPVVLMEPLVPPAPSVPPALPGQRRRPRHPPKSPRPTSS